jgi:hypothetical protein
MKIWNDAAGVVACGEVGDPSPTRWRDHFYLDSFFFKEKTLITQRFSE